MAHHGSYAAMTLRLSSSPSAIGIFTPDGGGQGIDNVNGVGPGETFALNTPHVFTFRRKGEYLYLSFDGLRWGKAKITSSAFTLTGILETTLGCAWANGAGAYWKFLDCDYYEVDSKQSAISDADVISHFALMKSRWGF